MPSDRELAREWLQFSGCTSDHDDHDFMGPNCLAALLARVREEGAAEVARLTAERDELRERWTCHACSLDVSPPVSEDDEPTVLCRECAEQMRTERDALRDALREIVDTARLIAGGSPGSLDQVELDWDDIMAALDVLRRLRGDA